MQKFTRPFLGQLVISKQGRDVGSIYVITKIENAEFVFVSNGRTKGIAKPKRKRIKHLILTQQKSDVIGTKLEADKKVDNSEIVFAVNKYKKGSKNE